MFRKAVIGVDPSPAQNALLSCLPELLRWGIESVVLVHVVRIGYGAGSSYGHDETFQTWLADCALPLRNAGLQVDTALVTGSDVARSLLEAADAHAADLIVVGSRSQNMVRRLFLGSVAREVIRQTSRPVLIQRLEPTDAATGEACAAVCQDALDRVLLATDGSPHSQAAESVAVALAPQARQTDVLTVLSRAELDSDADKVRIIATHHAKLTRRIEAAGGRSTSRVAPGEPAAVIAETGRTGAYTLIVVGKFGRGWARGKLIGSTAAQVCEAARRPVLMVPGQPPG